MATDATTLIIQRIQTAQSASAGGQPAGSTSVIAQMTALVGTAANYAQILGTVEGPAAQGIAIAVAGGATKATVDAAGQAAALSAAATTAGVGAAVVLVFSFVLAMLAASDGSGSAESEALEQLSEELGQLVQDYSNVGLGTYWQEKFGLLMSLWNSAQGGIGTDLDNLANEGINGSDVKADVGKFHDNALAFVNNLLPSKTPGAQIYWERPVVADRQFWAQAVAYVTLWGAPVIHLRTPGWYGGYPQPEAGPPLGGDQNQMVADPTSMLGFLLLGLQSYLSIEMLLNLIDPGQPTFAQFLSSFAGDLQEYTRFLYTQWALIVDGLIKSDLPSPSDMSGFLYFTMGNSGQEATGSQIETEIGMSQLPSADTLARTGYIWNGIYGVVHSYPPYGTYQPPPPVAVPSAAPFYIVDLLNTDGTYKDWAAASVLDYPYLFKATLEDWVFPWLKNRLILARMARWKALYLFNGYDQVWATLQKLQFLANPPTAILPAVPTLAQDGTVASGNWSTRELCTILDLDGSIMSGLQTGALEAGTIETMWNANLSGYSVFALLQVLDNIANGNWAGPPSYSLSGGPGPTRPLSLRGELAAIAA